MAILIFTPWYNIVNQVQIGSYRLVPIDTSATNSHLGSIGHDARVILKSYLTQPFISLQRNPPILEQSVKAATLILPSGLFDSDEVEILQYIISCAGVADREFIDSSLYLCTDNFKIVIQNYPTPIPVPFDPAISTSTKAGLSSGVFSPGFFREVKPWHISNQRLSGNLNYRLVFNDKVAQCLWNFYKAKDAKQAIWASHIFPSLYSFHQANTDANSAQADCIYSEAAIEKLILGGRFGEEKLIKEALIFLANKNINFEPIGSTTRDWRSVTFRKPDKSVASPNSIFEAWLRELVRQRNLYAHGGHRSQSPTVWSLNEHLLLAAYLYPLLLKLFVSNYDSSIAFQISNDDFTKLRIFEKLLARTDYSEETTAYSGLTNWSEVIHESRWLV